MTNEKRIARFLSPRGFASFVLAGAAALALSSEFAAATPVRQSAEPQPSEEAALEDVRTISIHTYMVRRGLKNRALAAQLARQRLENLPPNVAEVAPITGTAVAGSVGIPVITVKFKDTPSSPYPVSNLQHELFDGPWPTGTMSDDYREMSRGKFNVTGKVFEWIPLPQTGAFYAGPTGCNALCDEAHFGDLLTSALTEADKSIDFRQFDNDGPDNVPNSGDDDGFVDFVAFVHPEKGGECGGANNDNIWSHRFSMRDLTGTNFQTNDVGALGSNILIDDYVVMPAFACDGNTMIQIGVFSHEFGHAFGLPDLYDTKRRPESSGIGGWDLMASGSWGGDNNSPQTPSHMSAWAKEYLGWVTPRTVTEDESGIVIKPTIASGDVVRVDYSNTGDPQDTRYLLLEYRTKNGFDRSLPAAGLLITEVNNERVSGGLVNNSVNNRPFDMGVNVVEADGLRQLDNMANRGDAGDVFPGSSTVTAVDSSQAEHIRAAVCNIEMTSAGIKLNVFTSRMTCPESLAAAAVTPSDVLSSNVIRGTEVVVKGVLVNEGTNYFTDRQLVVRGKDESSGSIAVTSPAPLTTARPQNTESAPVSLQDVLGKEVVVRGHIQQQPMTGSGLRDVLVVDEVKELAPIHAEEEQAQQRKSINALRANELMSLRRGVAQMKAWNSAPRDSADFRRSWAYWANMHSHFGQGCITNNPSNIPGMGGVQAFTASNTNETNTWCKCEHGTDFFLTWHRMFLWYFERVLQAAAGDPSLRLPFWDYATDHSLPAAYRDQTYVNEAGQTVPNPLRVDARQTRVNTGTPLATGIVSAAQAMRQNTFNSFSGMLEETPHGAVHCAVGVANCCSGLMGCIPSSALDPIFWAHHTNIDRLYECWLRVDEPARLPSDPAHLDTKFTFVDADGNTVQRRVGDMLRLSQLGYSYAQGGGCPAAPVASAAGGGNVIPTASASEQAFPLTGPTRLERGVTTVPISVPPAAREMVPGQTMPSTERRIHIVIDGLKSDDKTPGVLYNVYLKGDGDQREQIGVINFFNFTATHHDGGAGHFAFDATDAMQRLGIEAAAKPSLVFEPTTGLVDSSPEAAASLISPEANVHFDSARIVVVP